jgi:putative peptidoglycan lipid II flippase
MLKNIFTNSSGILLSRITGFLRDFLQASILGANIWTDMFIVAFKLPNLFRRIFGEGAFAQSFIPTFAKSHQKSVFTVSILKKFLSILALLTILVYLFAPYFTKLMAWGFSQDVIQKASPLVIINFHYLILIFSVTFLSALLQYKGHFATTAYATALLNISMITALLLSKGMDTKTIVYNLSFAVVIGGALQLFVHLIMIKKLKLDRLFRVGYLKIKRGKSRIDDDIKRFKKGFLASILGGSTAQISAFIDGILASFLTAGSISYLYYANRVFQFPLAIFAIATSVAIFPKVARYLNQNKEKEARVMLNKSFWILLYLLSFATVVGIIFAKEIVWLLLQRGAFTQNDTSMTSSVLVMYLVGLIPFGLAKIFSLWLYSTHNQAKAAKISAISLVVNIILALILVRYLKVEGLALAGSLGGFVLFSLTIKHFGIKNFLDILSFKKLGVFIVFITTFITITLYLKGFISGYIQ